MSRKSKSKGFDDSLTLISLWGFLAIAFASFGNINLSAWTTGIIMIAAGGGLLLEGQILTARKWLSDGLQGREFSMFVTIVLGLFTVVAGILSLPVFMFASEKLLTLNGFVSILAFIFIALQRWVIE